MRLQTILLAVACSLGMYCARHSLDGGGQNPTPEPPPLSATGTVQFNPPDAHSASEVRSITVSFSVIGVTAASDFDVEFTAPGGLVYEKRTAPLGPDPFNPQALEFSLAVAGTDIDTYALNGTWQASLRLGPNVLTAPNFQLAP